VVGRLDNAGVPDAAMDGLRDPAATAPARELVDRLNAFRRGGSGGASEFFPALMKAFLSEARDDFLVGAGGFPDCLGVWAGGRGCDGNGAELAESSEFIESVRE
jgi:hypothetical protein